MNRRREGERFLGDAQFLARLRISFPTSAVVYFKGLLSAQKLRESNLESRAVAARGRVRTAQCCTTHFLSI